MTVTGHRPTQVLALTGGASIQSGGPDSASQVRATFENQTGIDPRPAEEIVAFSAVDDSPSSNASYVGAILHTDAPTDGSGYWIGVLGDGQAVVGTQSAVVDTGNVSTGSAAFDGPLRATYDGTRDGTVRFATTSPEILLPPNAGFVTNVQLYRDLRAVRGTYYTDGSRTGIEVQLRANNANSARSVAQATNGTTAILRNSLENETTIEAVNDIEVRQQGSTVTVSYEAEFGAFRRVLWYLYGVQVA